MSRLIRSGVIAGLVLTAQIIGLATDHYGQIMFTGLPVPGATVTAVRGDKTVIAASDPAGTYKLSGLEDGEWDVRVEMLGFVPLTQKITVGPDSTPAAFELKLLPFEEIKKIATISAVAAAPLATAPAAASPSAPLPPPPDADLARDAADGFLINGSVNNGAASPFAQPRAFGNTRTGQRSIYNGEFGTNFGNSSWDARPFSFTANRADKPAYTDLHAGGTFGGQVRVPKWRWLRNGPQFFFGFQRTADHNSSTQSALMPSARERAGDFSQTVDGFGKPVQIVDPETGRPFEGNRIPASRISPQAATLLAYYPQPNADTGRYNYQTTIRSNTTQNSFQSRLIQTLNNRMSINGTVSYQNTGTDSSNLFGFLDRRAATVTEATANWNRRFSQFFSLRAGYQLTRQTSRLTPHFADLRNVSGEAGIAGNDQTPANWGPPELLFASGVAGLSDGLSARSLNQTHNFSSEAIWRPRGRHTLTFGGAYRPQQYDVTAQQNPRGTFGFTGNITGFDFADFLLGLPHTSAIAFGNADKRFRAPAANAYLSDDWRVNPSLTINAGVRWEYEAPFGERQGRLVNLQVSPGFTTASAVVAGGSSAALLNPDRRGIQPRLAVAWRPLPASSLIVRAGYGIYRNSNVYQSIALALSQQPPLSKTFSLETSAATPLTLANGFNARPASVANTFAVDPDFRAGYAHNWQISLQRDLPMSLTITMTYLGTKGSHLMQEFVPNTYPAGAANPCLSCPTGFVYLTSNGSSLRNAGQVQLRRRLRAGLTATAQYTFAKATDDAAAFGGADLNGAAVAQDWLNLPAERARSNFDQRHTFTGQFEYSPRGPLTNFTFSGQLTASSGLPFTPIYLTSLSGTGVVGTVRADYTGEPLSATQPGYYVNPGAFRIPAAGRWGSAGRNSITGPSQFGLNLGMLRTFVLNNRWSADWRIDATNLLNTVTYSSIETRVGSPQFGLANRANPMRKLQSSLRLRF